MFGFFASLRWRIALSDIFSKNKKKIYNVEEKASRLNIKINAKKGGQFVKTGLRANMLRVATCSKSGVAIAK